MGASVNKGNSGSRKRKNRRGKGIDEEGWLGLPLSLDQRVCTACKLGHAEAFTR